MNVEEQELIQSVTREGIVTLNLAEVLHRAIEEQNRERRLSSEGEEPPLRRRRVGGEDQDIGSASDESLSTGGLSDDDEDEDDDAAWDEANVLANPVLHQAILANPALHVEFIYRNRRYRLKPIGTIEPIPKRIYEGENGGMYYWKTRDANGNRVPQAQWTRVYLKDYQRQQCLTGVSARTLGLAGYVDVDGECVNQPPGGRMHAARPPRKR